MGFVELQMTWQPSLLSEKRKKGPPLGLRNLGNSCYLNSVLQCLTYTPPLANFCLRSQHSTFCDASASNSKKPRDCPFCVLESWIARSLTLDLTLDAPSKILGCLKIFAENFRFGRQEDAHEFLRFVIDACHNTCLRLKKLRRKGRDEEGGEAVNGNTVVKDIFGGTLQSQVKCLGCGGESNKVDEIMDISLDVLNSGSLREAMHKFFQPEILDGSNKYKCESCKKLMAARKQLSIRQAPNILVIQLKRFEGIFGGKIDRLITFEELLVLSSFMCKASQDPQPEYNLFGTIVHSGYSQESGHYYAYIKDAFGRWYCCNDSFVSLSTLQEVLSEKVYILFFSRTNQRPGSFNATFSSNGVKPHDSNGSEAFKILKPIQTKPCLEPSSWKDKVGKPSSSPRVKFQISENLGPKKLPVTNNGKVDFHKTQNMAVNGGSKDSIRVEKNENSKLSHMNSNGIEKSRKVDGFGSEKSQENSMLSLTDRNGIDKTRKVDAFVSEKSHALGVANGNSTKPNAFVVNGPRSMAGGQADPGLTNACDNSGRKKVSENPCNISGPKQESRDSCDISGPKKKSEDLCNFPGAKRKLEPSCNISGPNKKSEGSRDNSVTRSNDSDVISEPKRKSKDSCDYSEPKEKNEFCKFSRATGKSRILLSQDAQSRSEVENMKEMLKKEAFSVLRSCGWYDDVYRFMYSRKKLCALEIGSTLTGNELEKKLIADAKPTFTRQIPESLKEELIKRLQSLNQAK